MPMVLTVCNISVTLSVYFNLYYNEAIHQRNSCCYILATVQYFPLMFDTAVCSKLSMCSIN